MSDPTPLDDLDLDRFWRAHAISTDIARAALAFLRDGPASLGRFHHEVRQIYEQHVGVPGENDALPDAVKPLRPPLRLVVSGD